MILESARTGVSRAVQQPALATMLWAWTLLLAAVVALPASTLFDAAFSLSPEADQLLHGFRLRFLEEAAQYDRLPSGGLIWAVVAALGAIALLGNAFVAGGVLEVLSTGDSRPFLHRFMHGAGRLFARFLRLLLIAAVTAGLGALVVSMALTPVRWLLSGSGSEWLQLVSSLLVPAGVLVVFGLAALVLDYARIRIALDDSRSALRAWWDGLTFVFRRIGGVAGIAAIFGAGLVALYAVSLAYQLNAPSNTAFLILVLFVLQQATLWARAALRVGSYAAALEYYRRTVAAAPPHALAAGHAPQVAAGSRPDQPPARDEAGAAAPESLSAETAGV